MLANLSVVEQRRSRRLACRLPVHWLRLAGELQGVALNFSLGGLFLEIDAVVEVGMMMRLRVTLPDGGTVDALGTSRFIGDTASGHGIGVQIEAMSDEDNEKWAQHYLERAERSTPPPARRPQSTTARPYPVSSLARVAKSASRPRSRRRPASPQKLGIKISADGRPNK